MIYKFNNLEDVQTLKKITAITLYTGYVVDRIIFEYDHSYCYEFGISKGGSEKRLELQEDEHIIEMTGEIGDYAYQSGDTVAYIKFKTDKGHTIEGGLKAECRNLHSFSYCNEGCIIFALGGSCENYLSDIYVSMYATPEQKPMPRKKQYSSSGGKSISDSLNGYYYTKNELMAIADSEIKNNPSKEVRKFIEERKNEVATTFVSKTNVTTEQVVFRAPTTGQKEMNHIIEKRTITCKAEICKNRGFGICSNINFKSSELETSQKDLAALYRAQAIKASYQPASEFSSHALTLEVAQNFLSQGYVLAYTTNPISPLLGLQIDGSKKIDFGKSEVQFQILGGSPVGRFWRFGNKWEEYDFTKKSWYNATERPVNYEYKEIIESRKTYRISYEKDEL